MVVDALHEHAECDKSNEWVEAFGGDVARRGVAFVDVFPSVAWR